MEKKTKYRILGILIVLAVVVVVLPLFLADRNDQQPDVAVIKSPPFPDQVVQMNDTDLSLTTQSATDENSLESDDQLDKPLANEGNSTVPSNVVQAKRPPESAVDIDPPKPVNQDLSENNVEPQPVDESQQHTAQTPDNDSAVEKNAVTPDIANVAVKAADTVEEEHGSIANNENKDVASALHEEQEISKNSNVKLKHASGKKASLPADKHAFQHKAHQSHKKAEKHKKLVAYSLKNALDKNGLIDIKTSAWIIQIGSFKNKSNAVRLVNRLRSNGYSAFIQHVNNAAFGESIRVYVGPEEKRASAYALADRLEKDMHVAGIVLSYKPLAI